MANNNVSVAIIGSFRQYYKDVLDAWRVFTDNGIYVASPKGSAIIQDGIPFVRFTSDSPDYDDCSVQSLTLHRIFGANLVYVVAPEGYIGRTTCYEIGRVIQAQKPLYFSHQPVDLPIKVSQKYISTSETLARNLLDPEWKPSPLFDQEDSLHHRLEIDLTQSRFWVDKINPD